MCNGMRVICGPQSSLHTGLHASLTFLLLAAGVAAGVGAGAGAFGAGAPAAAAKGPGPGAGVPTLCSKLYNKMRLKS